jgi:hypothetical protein
MALNSIRPKAVFVGFLVDFGGSLIVGFVLAIGLGLFAVASRDVSPAHLTHLRANVALKIAGLIGTLIATTLGGYVAARIGHPAFVTNAVGAGMLSLVVSFGFWLAEPAGVTPAWKAISGLLLTLPAAALGGILAAKTARSRA